MDAMGSSVTAKSCAVTNLSFRVQNVRPVKSMKAMAYSILNLRCFEDLKNRCARDT